MAFFGDFEKPVGGILNDDYHGDKVKFNFKSVSDNGTKVELKKTRAPSGTFTSELLFGRSCSCGTGGVKSDINAKLDTSGKVTTTATINNLADGLKVEFNNSFNTDTTKLADQSLSGAIKFNNDQVAFIGKVERTRLGKTVATTSAMSYYQNFGFGGELVFSNTPGSDGKPSANKTCYSLGTAYKTDTYSVFVKSSECLNKLTVGYQQKVSHDLSVAAEVKHTLNTDKDATAISIGTRYNLDDGSVLKAKLLSNGILGLTYNAGLSKNVKVGLSSECNVVDMSKGINIGASINYE